MNKSEIAKAIIKVMQEVKGVEKSMTIGSGNHSYKGTSDQDVKEVFNQALGKNGLCILPTEIEDTVDIHNYIDQYNKPKKQVFTVVKTKYMLLHESGESLQLSGYGHGVDPQDKGAGKATTYALKNCLLYTFLTPVGNIDDTETTHSQEIQTPPIKEQPKPKKPALTNEQFESAQKGTKAQINNVLEMYAVTTIQEKGLQIALTTAK
jgi:hypothetical protein